MAKAISEWARQCKERSPNRTHGFTTQQTIPEYTAWKNIKARCSNPNRADYERYGGRGIRVCEMWCKSFESFFSDMGPKPSPSHSIERLDSTGNYEPSNCVSGTLLEQANNTRANVFIEFMGKRQTMAQWAREVGLRLGTLHFRLKHGWSVEEALTTKVNQYL